jgi:putative ABC transport system permease protein
MRDDLAAAVRSLISAGSFSVAALLVLTLAIGATTALFSVVDAVVLRALPFDESHRIVAVGERQPQVQRPPGDTRDPEALTAVAPQNYLDWAAQQQTFESMAAIASGWLTLHRAGSEPESLVPQRVTAGFFDLLRAKPALGRTFRSQAGGAEEDRVVVLSDGAWHRLFGADRAIVGRTITLDDLERGQAVYEVVGVMPPGFAYPVGATRATDIWLPYVVPPDHRTRSTSSRINYLQVIARLEPGVSVAHAQAQMDQIALALQNAHPQWNKDNFIGVRPLVDHVVGARTKSWMLMLLAAVGIVLLIACANVANLLLARATSRQRELGIRAALGASRLRLVRLLLVESLVLSAAATVLAVLVAWWGIGILKAAMPDNLPRVTTIELDLRVLVAAAGLSLLTGLLFGAVPAFQVSTPDLTNALKEGGRTDAGTGGHRLRGALVVIEVALAVVLLVGAALFIGSFMALMRIDPGFTPGNILIAQVSPRLEGRVPRDYGTTFEELLERIRNTPGVVHASMIGGTAPLQGGYGTTTITIPDKNITLTSGEMIGINIVTPDYHRALEIPLRRGRLFESSDRKESAAVAIITESAARKYFPGEDPVGRTVGINGSRTIVGVVGDIHHTSLEMAPQPAAYIPLSQTSASGGMLVIRTSDNPYQVLAALKVAVFTVLPEVPLRSVLTMEELIGRRVAQRRLNMLLLGLFGVLGLFITAVGVYGVMAYAVSRRTREIGVRMALGATRGHVVSMILFNSAVLVGLGMIIGGAVASYLSAASKAFLFGIEATDPRAFAVAFVAIAAAALVACTIPARRASHVDPMVALRSE